MLAFFFGCVDVTNPKVSNAVTHEINRPSPETRRVYLDTPSQSLEIYNDAGVLILQIDRDVVAGKPGIKVISSESGGVVLLEKNHRNYLSMSENAIVLMDSDSGGGHMLWIDGGGGFFKVDHDGNATITGRVDDVDISSHNHNGTDGNGAKILAKDIDGLEEYVKSIINDCK